MICLQNSLGGGSKPILSHPSIMSLDFVALFAVYSEIFTKNELFDRGIFNADFKEMKAKHTKH